MTFAQFEELWNASRDLVKAAYFLHDMTENIPDKETTRKLYAQACLLHNAAVDFITMYKDLKKGEL